MSRTIKQLCQESLDVQNASNLSGVVHSFARALVDLREALGTSPNDHPIAVLWADKIAQLTGIQNLGDDRVMDAYRLVRATLDEEG